MNRLIRKLFGTPKTQPTVHRSKLGLDNLEQRDVPTILSVLPEGISFYRGLLSINGTDSNNEATVSVVNAKLQVTLTKTIVSTFQPDINSPPLPTLTVVLQNAEYDPNSVTRIDFFGRAGEDTFTNNTAIPCIAYGHDGADLLTGGTGSDELYGGSGNDKLYGDAGRDTLIGGINDDLLVGSSGSDQLEGGSGNDTYTFGGVSFGNDTIVEAANLDFDTLDFTNTGTSIGTDQSGVKVRLGTTTSQMVHAGSLLILPSYLTLSTTTGIENVTGSRFTDLLEGNARQNTLKGLAGNDTLRAGTSTNWLYGGEGNDVLHGTSVGTDYLFGDAGNDKLYSHGGTETDYLIGGADDDLLVSVGGLASDKLAGGTGNDSYWFDDNSVENPSDESDFEQNTLRSLHPIGQFQNAWYAASNTSTAISKNPSGQDLPDPTAETTGLGIDNFSDVPLFGTNGPSADDVMQAGTADCWFMAKLAAIANTDPLVIKQAVTDLGDGTYAVRYYQNSQPVYLRVDGDLYTSSGNLYYARTPTNVLWAPILEKAMAYFRNKENQAGNYATLNNWITSNHNEVGAAFGYSDSYINMTNVLSKELLLSFIQNAFTNDYAVTICGPGSEGAWSDGERSNAHLYTVLGVENDANGNKLLRIRNPYNGRRDGAAIFTITLDQAFTCGNGFYITSV